MVVTDTVPSGMNVSSADDTYVGNGVWEIASIDSGSEVSLTLYATVNSLDALTNEVNVTSKEFDNNTDDNKASAPEVKAIPVADLSVSISLSSNEVILFLTDWFMYLTTLQILIISLPRAG